MLGDRFTVKVEGQADSIDELKAALADLDLGALEAMKDEGVKANEADVRRGTRDEHGAA